MKSAQFPQPKPVLVTAAIIRDQNRILIAQRKADSLVAAGKWEFPGGKVEHGEHPETCLIREIKEELDLEIEVERLFDVASHVYQTPKGPLHIVLICYFCKRVAGQARKVDVQDVRWVTLNELPSFVYAEADVPLVNKLLENS